MHFKNKVVWITGASSGIGAELARQFAREEAKLILTARNTDALLHVRETCSMDASSCVVLPANMLQTGDLQELTNAAVRIYGHIDIVIFNAGISQRSYLEETGIEVYRQLMELNFFAPITITKYLLAHFRTRQTGHIVAIGSIAGLMGFPLRTGYAASKHALKGFYETLQVENSIAGLDITIVSPGRINTLISMNALTGDGGAHGKMDEGQLHGIPVAVCARKIIRAVAQKRKHVIIARSERLLWWIWWYARPLYYNIARKKGLRKN